MVRLCGVLLALLVTAACGESTAPELRLDAGVRVVHAAPETAALEVIMEGERRAILEYAEVSNRITLSSGQRRIELRLAGATAALIDVQEDLASAGRYTILAAGRANTIQPIVLRDDPTPADTGETRIRFVHAAPTAGVIDLHITEPGEEISAATVTLAGVAFGESSEYLELPSRTYRIRATTAGTRGLVIDLPLLVLSSNRVLTIVAMDTEGSGPPHGLIALSDVEGR